MKNLKFYLAQIAFLCMGLQLAFAQGKGTATVVGTVIDERTREGIPHVQVLVQGTTLGTTTDANGNYQLSGLSEGHYTIVARYIGYGSVSEHIHLKEKQRRHLDLYMQEQSIDLEGIVVSANRHETLRRLAPSLVTVLGAETFIKTNSENLSQGLRFQPGLRVEDNCQNCGFNQVRINGLDGAYAQILIDSRAVFSSLVGVYGLEQIPASMIERVEVMRGGGSALFGSNAVGGVINIITKEPLHTTGSITQTLTSFDSAKGWSKPMSTTSFNGALVTEDRRAAVMVFGQHTGRDGLDYDGDSFTELPELKQRALGFRSYYKTGLYSKLTAEYRSMQEYRRGGDRLDRPAHEARIAEYLQHFVNGGSLRFDLGGASGRDNLSLYASAQHVLRRSYYGGGDLSSELLKGVAEGVLEDIRTRSQEEPGKSIEEYLNATKAEELESFGDALGSLTAHGISRSLDTQLGATYIHRFPKNFDLTLGLEGSFSALNDKSGYRRTNVEQSVNTYSKFGQLEYKHDMWHVLVGGRLDYVKLLQNGKRSIEPLLIFSPRANVRFNPIKDLSLRLSYSEGFRAPQFFDEELHVELAGGEAIARILSNNLKEERSRSISFSADWYKSFGSWQMNLMGESFYTSIRNQFIASPIEQEVDGIKQRTIINDSKGLASVYGVTLEGKLAYKRLFEMQAGLTLQRSLYGSPKEIAGADEETGQEEITTRHFERTPNIYGYLTSTIRPTKHLYFNLSTTYTGSMSVPHEAAEGWKDIEGLKPNDQGYFDQVVAGQRYRGTSKTLLVETKPFVDLDFKVGYEFDLSCTIKLNLNMGVQNIFGAYQRDTDMGPTRASTYVYGPMLPRRYFASATLTI